MLSPTNFNGETQRERNKTNQGNSCKRIKIIYSAEPHKDAERVNIANPAAVSLCLQYTVHDRGQTLKHH